jgi:choline dehydrogenase
MKNVLTVLAACAATASTVVTAAAARSVPLNYVIIGGGPAGFVLLEQLTRNPKIKVTLIEAGPDGSTDPALNSESSFSRIMQRCQRILNIIKAPADIPDLLPFLALYTSQPDPNLGGLTPNIWQGKVLGGGTAVNGMAYCRGAPSVFDEWAQVSGNGGLAWNSMLQSFKNTSHYTSEPDANYPQVVNTSVYGNGPLEISRTARTTGFDFPFSDALQSTLGIKEIDMNDGQGIGVDLGLQTIRVSNRTRSYAYNTFGYLAATRPNVQIIHNATVTKINFSNLTATGVTYVTTANSQAITLNAQEVIVSAGAIGTPKLLMLSGIGPASTLKSLKIPVILDAPDVGQNLYDHHLSVVELQVTNDILTSWQYTQNATERAIAQEQYAKNFSGPLGWVNGEVFAGARVPDSVFNGTGSTYYQNLPADRPQVLYEFSTSAFVPTPNISSVSVWATCIQPEVSGHLTLNSSDWRDDPLIYSNYYGSKADKALILYAYKQLRNTILKSSYLKPYIIQETFPGANVTSDADVWKAIQQSAQSFHHPVGTVAIGKVLDANWRIKGLNGIRVVDSSSIPSLPTCHIQSDVYAIAFRASLDICAADKL